MVVLSTITLNPISQSLVQYEPLSSQHEVPVVWHRAKGYYVWDTELRRYLDFTSGIFVANTGHNPPEVVRAIREQSRRLLHSYAFPNEPRMALEKKLTEMTGMDKVFLCSTGAEAIEATLRIMKAYRPVGVIISLYGSNHGRTQGARYLTAGALDYKFLPSDGVKPKRVSGIILETYFGWNAQFHPVKWVQEWCHWAQANDIPVCFDEIQSGFGRTGKLFGYEYYGVKPDLICVGKALGGGLPISAVIGRADLLDKPYDLSSTHTGNPVCCAAALANLSVLERGELVQQAFYTGEHIESFLRSLFSEYKVNGKGMVWAIDLEDKDLANKVVDLCADKGLLLVKTNRGTIKIGAPLITPLRLMKQGISIIRQALEEVK